MTPPTDEALDVFKVLRVRLKSNLRRVMEIESEPPHYVAAFVVAAGCEAVGALLDAVDGRKRQTHDVFVDEIVMPHKTPSNGLTKAIGRDLFKAIRHGIAHLFETKSIVLADDRQVKITVNWGTRPPHFGPRKNPPGIWVNLPTMKADFEAMLNKYLAQIQASSRPGRTLSDRWERESTHPATGESEPHWRALLGEEDKHGSTR